MCGPILPQLHTVPEAYDPEKFINQDNEAFAVLLTPGGFDLNGEYPVHHTVKFKPAFNSNQPLLLLIHTLMVYFRRRVHH